MTYFNSGIECVMFFSFLFCVFLVLIYTAHMILCMNHACLLAKSMAVVKYWIIKKQSRLTINPLCYCSLCCQQSVLCAFIIFFCFTLKQKKTRLQSIMQLSVVKSRWFFRQEMIQYSLSSRLSTVYSNIRMYYWYIPVPVSFQMF